MAHLKAEQRRQLRDDIASKDYAEGKVTTAELARKYGMTWKHMASAIRREKQNMLDEQLDSNFETAAKSAPVEAEQTSLNIPEDDDAEVEPLITPPKPDPSVLDPNKFYCAPCHRGGRLVEITREMTVCPSCGGALLWAN